MPTPTDDRARLWSLIQPLRFAMFTTRHAGGRLHARPMTVQNRGIEEDDALWFFMSRTSDPVADLESEPSVNVAFADRDKDRYVSIAGDAAVVDDRAKARSLWSRMAEAWFPGGPDDPDLALVRVDIAHAEYWEVKESKPVQLFKMLKAAASGERPQGLGTHGEIRLDEGAAPAQRTAD